MDPFVTTSRRGRFRLVTRTLGAIAFVAGSVSCAPAAAPTIHATTPPASESAGSSAANASSPSPAPPEEDVVAVERRDVTVGIALPVVLSAGRVSEVVASRAGTVTSLAVQTGTRVRHADRLAVIHPPAGRDVVVTAPIDGEVLEMAVTVGASVEAHARLLTLVEASTVVAPFAVPEARVPSVRVGQPVRLHCESFPDRTYAATVASVAPAVAADHTVRVEAVVQNPDYSLRHGAHCDGSIDVAVHHEAVVVPRRALAQDATGAWHVVVDAGEGGRSPRTIALGEALGENVEVVHGLTGDERIVVPRTHP